MAFNDGYRDTFIRGSLANCLGAYLVVIFYLVYPASFMFYSLLIVFQCKKKRDRKESVSGPRRRSHCVRCCRHERRVEVAEGVV